MTRKKINSAMKSLRFRCMYSRCRKMTVGDHSTCRSHLRFEVALMVAASVAAFFALYYFSSRFQLS